MKDSSLSRRRRIKLKLLVSFNGAFRRRSPSRKLRYVGGETRIISVDRNTSFQILKSKIAHLICPGVNFEDFGLKYHVSESFCGDNGEQQGPVLGLLESDDDLRCMIEEYETELEGKLRTRLWIFVCNANDGFDDTAIVDKYSAENVNGDWFCWKNNGFVKPIGVVSDGDDIRKIENPFCLIHKYENKSKKFGDDSLRKMVLKQQLLSKKLNGIPSFCSNREESVTELASENGISQSPPQKLCSELGSPSSSESKNLNFGGDPYGMNMIDCKRTNGPIGDIEGSGKILPVAESNSDSLNSKDGNSHMRCRGSNGRLLGQSRIIFGNCNAHYMLSSNRFVAAEKLQRVSFNSSINRMANGSDPNCELGTVDRASFNIVPQNGDCNMVKRRIVPPICHCPLDSDTNPMESLQITGSQWRAYGGSIRNHIFGPSEVRIRRASPYHISTQINVSELGEPKKFRLDGKTWRGRFYLRFWSSSNISSQCPSTRSQSAGPGNALPGSHCYQTRGKQGTIDDGCMLNPPHCGEEKLLKPVAHIVPKQGITNLDNSQVACAGNGEPVLPISNSLLDARAADVYLDILTSLGIEKIDDADETLGEISLHIVGMGGQTPLNRIEEQHSNNQSNALHSPCKSIVTELCSENRLLDVESGHETLDIHQGGAKELKNKGASDVDLSSHNLSLESEGKVQLSVCYARGHISETSLKSQSNGLALMNEQCINQGSNEMSRKCDYDDDKTAAVQHSRKFDSSSAEKDKNKKTISCLKGNDGTPADIIALCAHLATKELQIIKNADLEYIKELGNGTYGTVYYGKWKGSDVAIKRIKPSCFSNGAKEEDRLAADFWKEAHTLGQLHHPNIVALYGVVTDGPANCLATVTEYMVNGSLKQVLCRKDRTINRRKRMIIAMDAAFGMEYLHGKNIVHFDLKSHNFLVNMRDPQRPVCKIGDLGLSKVKQRTLVSGGIRGTIPWMAPELLRGRNLVSEKVDVFSFGIVMWELLTCEEPYANMGSEEIVAGIIRGNLRPEIPSWCDPSWRSLMERCWSSDPDCRPSFSEVAKELRAMAASMNIK